MLVLKSTHDNLRKRHDADRVYIARLQQELLAAQYHVALLQSEVNALHMQLAARTIAASQSQFTKEEIRTLITLCHPDRHDGKDAAKRMTQKLLALRK